MPISSIKKILASISLGQFFELNIITYLQMNINNLKVINGSNLMTWLKPQASYLIPLLLFAACNSKSSDLEKRVEGLEEKVNTEKTVTPTNSNIASVENTAGKLPVLTFKEKSFDFGSIKEGEKVKHTFEFTNTGEAPLIIQNASASCGCTVPDWPHDPIEPGKSGKIDVEFNSSGKSGPQSKTVSITANTNPSISVVSIVGTIEANK